MKRLAICLGLTRVDPAAYGGWDGDCPGADWDVNAVAGWCHAGLFDGVTALVNEFAQPAYLKPAFREAANSLVGDDLLVLFFSGHGGRRPDLDGDEIDGQDETLVLWDGQLVDDVIASYLRQVPAGVRIWFFTDSCHSGTNYRGGPVRRAKPSRPGSIRLSDRSTKGLRASLLHFGGCADPRYSYGLNGRGVFTSTMLKVASRARKSISYRELFDRTAERMPKYQVPTMSEWGGPSFADREALR